jgi:DNA ligase (NAD+)
MGPAKREKALSFKVPIISETELLALLPNPDEAPADAITPEELAAEAKAPATPGSQGNLFG